MLSDSKIRLRALEALDATYLYDWENLSDLWLTSATLAPYSRTNIIDYITNYRADPFGEGQLRLMIETLDDNTPSGLIDLYNVEVRHRRACIGILISPAKQRCGIALRALHIMEDYCRRHLRLHQLLAAVPVSNTPSRALFSKAGFSHAATLPQYLCGTAPDEYIDALVMYKIL